MKHYYFDYAGTTPVDPKVIEVMQPYFFEKFGNPSSLHHYGQTARKAVEEARSTLASFLGAKEEEIILKTNNDKRILFVQT